MSPFPRDADRGVGRGRFRGAAYAPSTCAVPIVEEQAFVCHEERLGALPNCFCDRTLELSGRGNFEKDRMDTRTPARLLEIFARHAKVGVGRRLQRLSHLMHTPIGSRVFAFAIIAATDSEGFER